MAKKTKEQTMDEIKKTFKLELKRNYIKAISQGYNLALKEILEASEAPDFDVKVYCERELKLRSGIEKGVDGIYDKKKEKIGKE